MSYLRYLCLFAYSGIQHIMCCVFVLFVFVLCTLRYQFLWIVHFDCLFVFFNVYHVRDTPGLSTSDSLHPGIANVKVTLNIDIDIL